MNFDNYNSLNSILKEQRRELRKLEEEIQYNHLCMKEAESYVRSFIDSEPVDFKVFSPRNAENVHKDEIEKTNKEKESYEMRNQQLEERRDALRKQIKQIEKILECRKHNLTVLNIQEEDRQRIARDLHDIPLQNLAHLVHKIELSSLYIDQDPVKAKLELSVVNKVLRETIDEIRNIVFDLRPMTFDDLGLKTALERLLVSINENNKYSIEADIDDVSCETNSVLVSVYRIVQECLNNIDKHAEADSIFLSVKNRSDRCVIDIKDNGKGFNIKKNTKGKHFGLSLMRERIELLNGKIQISSKVGKGTKIHIEIPLDFYMNVTE